MSRFLLFSLALVCCVSLVACGSSMSSSLGGSPTANNGVPMTLTIGDTPPNGVAVLFFEASITGASLQPSDATKPAVSVLSTPVEVEFGHLQTDTAFLSLAKVPPDTYNSITLTFANPELTVVNHSMATVSSCADNSVCQTTPTLSPMTSTVSSAPFPITITQNSVVGIRLDFNVNSSVQPDLSINPTVTIKHLTQRHDSDEGQEMEKLEEIDGQVTSAPTATGFTLMNERSGQSFTISVDTNTVYEDFNRAGCAASPADISCVQMGQILNVDLSENGMGSMLAKRVEFESDANKQAIKGTITSVDDATHFHMVAFNEEPTVGGISEGSPVAVTIDPNAKFQVGREEIGEVGGFSMSGASFVSGADLMVDQDVQIRPGMVSTTGSVPAVTTDLVRLWPSQITGQVGAINSDTGTFTLTMLSPLFTGATPPVTTINVVTFSGMNFMDFPGLGSLTPGNTVSVRGLLFNTPGTPTLVTRAMRMHHGD